MKGLDPLFSFYAVFAFILGLIFGSFLNVVIYRVPRGASIVFPGSHCGACGAPIKAMDNIPLLSFALLGGRCRACRARISFSYPMVELGAGLIFTAIVFKTGLSLEAILEFAFACVMIALVFIDARHQLLPNAITYPAFLFAVAAATARAASGERLALNYQLTSDIEILFPGVQPEFTPWSAAIFGASLFAMAAPGFRLLDRLDPILFGEYFDREEAAESVAEKTSGYPERRAIRVTMILGVVVAAAWAAMAIFLSSKHQQAFEEAYGGLLNSVTGALISGGLVWCIRALYFFIRGFEGMGLGDIKMMSLVGAFLGFSGALSVLTAGSVLGAITGLILICFSRRGGRELKTRLPFGAYLGAAALIILILPSFNFAKP